MPYYHVYIDMDGEEAEETDLSHEQSVKNIMDLYNKRKKFLCKGKIVHPVDVTTIRIIETEQPANEILGKIKATRGLWATFTFSDFQLLEEQGRDVTREFIQVGRRRQKKKKVVKKRVPTLKKDVFIVHGRDHEPMKELKTMLKESGLNPIVLEELPGGSMTIIEKLEKYLDEVGYAFAILTPDDLGCLGKQFMKLYSESLVKKGESEADKNKKARFFFIEVPKLLMNRARQNVMLEFGCCIAKLGRERVCCLYKRYVELPSDMNGILHVRFEESLNEVRAKIVKELKAAGYEIKD